MTFRIDDVRIEQIDPGDRHVWHWRIKGIQGQGIYGSIVTNDQGRGLYLVAEGDWPGLHKDWERRLCCLVAPDAFDLLVSVGEDFANEALATQLLQLGWGPQVFA